jgi:ABC-2 type transport system permease protein
VSAPGTLALFASHELRLAWRDARAMVAAGSAFRARAAVVVVLLFAAFMHALAFSIVARFATMTHPDKAALIVISGVALMSWSLMLSQAMESVTRILYARADLDLILSSPVDQRRVFCVRIGVVAISVTAMALLLAAPFINVLALWGGRHWLAAYGVVLAMGAAAAGLAVAFTAGLFRTIGPRRTRLMAQILAAVVGAAFVIGIQAAAILSYGTLSRFAVLQSQAVVAHAPDAGSLIFWPARAILGDITALCAVLGAAFAVLIASILRFSPRFAGYAIEAAGLSHAAARLPRVMHAFRRTSPQQTLRRKEWLLLRRDPWLMSQTLMQLLYLLPPGLLLWRSFADGSDALILLVPVLVMAAGQLAGGLAWLAISGEDAPDLVATAPVATSLIVRAKIEAVMGGIALVFAPFLIAMALASPLHALLTALAVAAAAAAATQIQWWFRSQARRTQFRRRHTASRLATYAEAFASISCASTAALAAAGSPLAVFPALGTLIVLLAAFAISPRPIN